MQSLKFAIGIRKRQMVSLFVVVRDFLVQREENLSAMLRTATQAGCAQSSISTWIVFMPPSRCAIAPRCAGKPVGVGGARDRRGVLTTCNYEARKFGVHSAMPTFMALQRCPKSDRAAHAIRCLSARSRSHSRNPVSVHVNNRTALARRSLPRCHRAPERARSAGAGDPEHDLSEERS